MIRVGILGCGYWGPNLVRAFNETEDAEVTWVVDTRPGRREFIQTRYPFIRTAADPKLMIEDPDVSAVAVVTPPNTHYELARRALEAGKHVFVEKPLAMESKQAAELVKLAEAVGRVLMAGHLFIYSSAVAAIRSLLDSGALGDAYFITSTRANLGPPNTAVDVVWDLAPHDLAVILHLFRESPSEVEARGKSFTNSGVVETAFITLNFPSGRMAQVNVSWLTPAKVRLVQLVCSRGTVLYDDLQAVHKVQVFETGVDNRVIGGDHNSAALSYGPGRIVVPALAGREPLLVECEDFIRSIKTGQPPLGSGKHGLQVVQALEAISLATRQPGVAVAVGR